MSIDEVFPRILIYIYNLYTTYGEFRERRGNLGGRGDFIKENRIHIRVEFTNSPNSFYKVYLTALKNSKLKWKV